jgi:hypothetical protein
MNPILGLWCAKPIHLRVDFKSQLMHKRVVLRAQRREIR